MQKSFTKRQQSPEKETRPETAKKALMNKDLYIMSQRKKKFNNEGDNRAMLTSDMLSPISIPVSNLNDSSHAMSAGIKRQFQLNTNEAQRQKVMLKSLLDRDL